MALWGKSDADESKPKWLTTAEKKEVYATASGWVREAGSSWSGNGNTSAQAEVLACIGSLSTDIGAADVTEVEWITTSFSKSAAAASGRTLSVRVRYNEPVTVTGSPTLVVTNDTNANHTLVYASGTGSNELVFSLVIAAANAATDADDVLSIAAQNILKPGGATMKDATGTATDSAVAISGTQGTAAGTITVVA